MGFEPDAVVTGADGKVVVIDSVASHTGWVLNVGVDGAPVWNEIESEDTALVASDQGWLSKPRAVLRPGSDAAVITDQRGRVILLGRTPAILVQGKDARPVWKAMRVSNDRAKPDAKGWLEQPRASLTASPPEMSVSEPPSDG
jgi:hypothetical protein